MKALFKEVVDLKVDNRSQRRDIRHLHCLVMKLTRNQPALETTTEDGEDRDMISYYIPSDSYRNLQKLDKKLLEDCGFFEESVRIF